MSRLRGPAWIDSLLWLCLIGCAIWTALLLLSGGPPPVTAPASPTTVAAAESAVLAWTKLNAGPREFTPPYAGMGLALAKRLSEAAREGATERTVEDLRNEAFEMDARGQALDEAFRQASRLTAQTAQALWEEANCNVPQTGAD